MNKQAKSREFYRDGLKEQITGPVRVTYTSDGHAVERYMRANGTRRFFVTLANTHWCAHGDSIAQAISDAIWKDPNKRPSMESLVASIKKEGKTHKITLNEFRLLTGACLVGCRSVLEKQGRDESPLTAHDIRDLVSKEWGNKLLSILGWLEVSS